VSAPEPIVPKVDAVVETKETVAPKVDAPKVEPKVEIAPKVEAKAESAPKVEVAKPKEEKSKEVVDPALQDKFKNQLDTLNSMGFSQLSVNVYLLQKNKGSIEQTIFQLVEMDKSR